MGIPIRWTRRSKASFWYSFSSRAELKVERVMGKTADEVADFSSAARIYVR